MPMEESAMIELVQNMVIDNLGKEWACSLEVEKSTVTVHVEGYSKQYPLILSQDNTFIKNVNKKLKKLGIKYHVISKNNKNSSRTETMEVICLLKSNNCFSTKCGVRQEA